jgi:hypothetical protein
MSRLSIVECSTLHTFCIKFKDSSRLRCRPFGILMTQWNKSLYLLSLCRRSSQQMSLPCPVSVAYPQTMSMRVTFPMTTSATTHLQSYRRGLQPRCGDTRLIDPRMSALLRTRLIKTISKKAPGAGRANRRRVAFRPRNGHGRTILSLLTPRLISRIQKM